MGSKRATYDIEVTPSLQDEDGKWPFSVAPDWGDAPEP